jgi:hypothetical protein
VKKINHGGKNLSSTDKKTSEPRKFGLIVGSVLIILGIFPLVKGKTTNLYLILPGALLFVTALVRPVLLGPVNKIWLKVGHLLGKINSFIILSVIFYALFTPMRLLLMTFSKEKKFAFRRPGDSYWIRRKREDFRETMKRQF